MKFASIISRQSKAVIVVVLLLCAAGLTAAWQLPTAIFPNTDFPRIVVTIDDGEVPADQMLAAVTQPIEEAMNGIPGIQRIKSTTARGSAEINLFFNWNTNILQTQQIVQGRLAQIALPPTATITHVDRLTLRFFLLPATAWFRISGTERRFARSRPIRSDQDWPGLRASPTCGLKAERFASFRSRLTRSGSPHAMSLSSK